MQTPRGSQSKAHESIFAWLPMGWQSSALDGSSLISAIQLPSPGCAGLLTRIVFPVLYLIFTGPQRARSLPPHPNPPQTGAGPQGSLLLTKRSNANKALGRC